MEFLRAIHALKMCIRDRFDGVANTLFVPLVARINISKKFPEYFMDEKALELEKYLPQGVDKGSSEYSNMASVARYYNMDKTVIAFAKSYAESNIVYLGAGLELSLIHILSQLVVSARRPQEILPVLRIGNNRLTGSVIEFGYEFIFS